MEFLKTLFLSIYKYFIGPPILGWGLMGCIYELTDAWGIQLKKNKKLNT